MTQWKLVPCEPTEEMVRDVYAAMIAASPPGLDVVGALDQFATMADMAERFGGGILSDETPISVTLGDFRRARAVLAQIRGEGQ